MIRFATGIFVTLLVAIAMQSCTEEPNTAPSTEKIVVPIGIVRAGTGSQTDLGSSIGLGALLAVIEYNMANPNGRFSLKLYLEDDSSTVDGARRAFRTAIDIDRVVAILGPTTSTLAFAADSIAVAAGVPVLAVSNSAEGITAIGPGVFRVGLPESAIIPNTVAVTKAALGYGTCAVVTTSDDAYSLDARALFETALQQQGVAIVHRAAIQSTSTDFAADIAAIRSAGAEVVILCTQLAEGARFITAARNAGLPYSVRFIASSGIGGTNIAAAAGASAEGLIAGSGWLDKLATPGNEVFVANFATVFGKTPTSTAAQSHAAVHIIANALETMTTVNGPALRARLESTTGFATILGNITYSATSREPGYQPVVKVLHNGIFELF